jgi:hypothetical protein
VLEYYQRYGLQSNPFILRVLDPLQNAEDDGSLLRDIDGFSRINSVDEYLKDRVGSPENPADRPAFVLITGSEKSGLTSASNEVLARYRRIRDVADRFVAVQVAATDHSISDLYRRWVAALYNRLRPKLQLLDTVSTKFYDARKLMDSKTLDYDLQSVFIDLLPAMKANPGAVLGSCFEKIKSQQVIEVAQVVFENFPAVCVFTAQPGFFDVDDFETRNADVHVLRLGHLNSEEVKKVLEKKWGQASSLPFHVPTLGNFCENKKHTVGVVLTVAEKLLRKRVQAYEKLNGQNTWPQDTRLGFTDINTLELLEALEVVVNGGS